MLYTSYVKLKYFAHHRSLTLPFDVHLIFAEFAEE